VGGTDVLLEDLMPLTPSYFRLPQVSDEGPTGTVVTGAPAGPVSPTGPASQNAGA